MLSPYSLPQHCILYLHLRQILSQAVLYTRLKSLSGFGSSLLAVRSIVRRTSSIAPSANLRRRLNSSRIELSAALLSFISRSRSLHAAGRSMNTAPPRNTSAVSARLLLSILNSAVTSVAASTNAPAQPSFFSPAKIPATAAAVARIAAR